MSIQKYTCYITHTDFLLIKLQFHMKLGCILRSPCASPSLSISAAAQASLPRHNQLSRATTLSSNNGWGWGPDRSFKIERASEQVRHFGTKEPQPMKKMVKVNHLHHSCVVAVVVAAVVAPTVYLKFVASLDRSYRHLSILTDYRFCTLLVSRLKNSLSTLTFDKLLNLPNLWKVRTVELPAWSGFCPLTPITTAPY